MAERFDVASSLAGEQRSLIEPIAEELRRRGRPVFYYGWPEFQGDIYKSGTEKEVRERFLRFWPGNAATLSRAMPGNHEMYSGGIGYFDHVLPAFGQQTSYFSFANAPLAADLSRFRLPGTLSVIRGEACRNRDGSPPRRSIHG
jgi:hypothetical protein